MTDAVRIPCAMSGEREVLTVYPVGKGGVSFCYGDDASVIVDGAALLKVRAIIDQQITPPPPANIGADSPSAREKALDAGMRTLLLSLQAVYSALDYRVMSEDPYGSTEPDPNSVMGQAKTAMRNARALLATPAEGGSDG